MNFKKLIISVIAVLGISSAALAQSSDVKTIALEQVNGDFVVKNLSLSEGTYVFEITNSGVDHPVGFVVAPKGKTDQANHIKEAYVTETVVNGKTQKTKEVHLTKGEYSYFCPLNPTPLYTITVK